MPRDLTATEFVPFVKGTCAASGDFSYVEAAADGDKPKLKKVSATAYTGVPMRVGLGFNVIVDLAGMEKSGDRISYLKDHDSSQIVGHSESVEIGSQKIKTQGLVSGVGEAAQEVSATAANGFPWQMSIGAEIHRMEFVDRNETVKVNGRNWNGPLYVARKSSLREISFTAVGADGATSGNIAASTLVPENRTMAFEQWLQAKGFDHSVLTDTMKTTLKAAFDAEIGAANLNQPTGSTQTTQLNAGAEFDVVADMRAKASAERERMAGIEKLCNGQHSDIAAQAIKEGWTVEKTELAVLRASRPKGPAIHSGTPDVSDKVIEAAICVQGNLANVEKLYDDQTLQAAHTRFRRGIGLQELLLKAAIANGYAAQDFRVHDGNMQDVLRAAFSTQSLPGILSNTANKFMLEGFMAVENTWRSIAAIRPVGDFKEVTSYRLTGDFEFEPLGPTGEIKHSKAGEESFTNKARTYAKMHSIAREHIINDDQGALSVIPKRIGRGGALGLNKIFWTAFLDNSTFFATGNKNYQEGASTALSIDSLTEAELLFLNQTDPDGKPLGIVPEILLVPNALNVKATSLTRDLEIRDTTANTKYPTGNPHAGKFRPVRSSYLSNSTITGYSAKAWYLLADPANLPVIEVVFLDGIEMPTVETAEADFAQMGIQMRGFWDFGVKKQEYRAGVKSKGEA